MRLEERIERLVRMKDEEIGRLRFELQRKDEALKALKAKELVADWAFDVAFSYLSEQDKGAVKATIKLARDMQGSSLIPIQQEEEG